MFVVICYDISDDRRRYRIEKAISNHAYRVQESVFEAHVAEKDFVELRRRVVKLMDPSLDNVRYYYLCKTCISAVDADGVGLPPDEDEDVTVVV